MMKMISPTLVIFLLLPALLLVASGALAAFRPPSATIKGALFHFAAGVVFSVVAVELIPDLLRDHRPVETAVGFSLGVVAMLALRAVLEHEEKGEKETSDSLGTAPPVSTTKVPVGLLVGVAVDVLLDGLLLGVGFAAGAKEGRMLALALAVELISLGLATATSLVGAGLSRQRVISLIAGLAALFCLGGVLGLSLLSHLSPHLLAGVISFGAAALLFLVTEELLIEAHEAPESAWLTATFFAGFLLFLLLGMVG